jgi:hypothetical protein
VPNTALWDDWKRRHVPVTVKQRETHMLKNTMRGILGLVLTAAATWLANYLVDRMFGPDEEVA